MVGLKERVKWEVRGGVVLEESLVVCEGPTIVTRSLASAET